MADSLSACLEKQPPSADLDVLNQQVLHDPARCHIVPQDILPPEERNITAEQYGKSDNILYHRCNLRPTFHLA